LIFFIFLIQNRIESRLCFIAEQFFTNPVAQIIIAQIGFIDSKDNNPAIILIGKAGKRVIQP